MRLSSPSLLLLIALGGCLSATTATPDYRVRIAQTPDGKAVALPPECLEWSEHGLGAAWGNDSAPPLGCAQARNLAAQIDRPEDLIEGKERGAADPVAASASIARYRAGKTVPLIDPNKTAPTATVKPEDSRTGGGAIK